MGKVAENLQEKIVQEKELQSEGKKLNNIKKGIEDFDGEHIQPFWDSFKDKIKAMDKQQRDLQFQIETISHPLSSLPIDEEIEDRRRKWRELLQRQKQNYLNSGLAFGEMPHAVKKKSVNLIFDGKDEQGKRHGIYVQIVGPGQSRKFQFEAYGRFGDIRGWIRKADSDVISDLHPKELQVYEIANKSSL